MGPDDTVSATRGKRAPSKEPREGCMRAEVNTPPSDAPLRMPVRVSVALHEQAPGGDHLDLFVGPAVAASPDEPSARCWRLPCGAWTPEGLARGRFAATELAPHRAEYLDLTEPRVLSGGRGRAVPLAKGSGWMSGGQLEALGRLIAFNPDGVVEISLSTAQEGR